MLLIGLTGSIGMGKTETARLFARAGVPVYDADAAVHALYDKGGAAVELIAQEFPDAVSDGAVDRNALSKLVVGNADAVKKLEGLIHPLVGKAQMAFLAAAEKSGAPAVLLDIPLLFETGGDTRVDVVVVVSTSPEIQRERVLSRANMSADKLDAILARQMPDAHKRARAHFIVDTSHGLAHAGAQVDAILARLRHWPARVWAARKAQAG